MALLLGDRGAGALEAAARKADGGAYRAILGPIGKRIEKKLPLQRSGNSQRPPIGAEDGTTWIVTDGSVGMEAQGIAVAFLPTRGDRACRSLPTFESALARRNRLLQHRIDVVVGPEQERIEHAHLQAAICGRFLQTSQREIVHMVGVAYAAPPSTNDGPINTTEVRHSHKDTAFIGENSRRLL